jgi:hypothetical protein
LRRDGASQNEAHALDFQVMLVTIGIIGKNQGEVNTLQQKNHCLMLTFFHGWRRKIGVLTMVMACVVSIGWIRSLVKFEAVELISNNRSFSLLFDNGRLRWFYAHGEKARVEKWDIRFLTFFRDEPYPGKYEIRRKRLSFVMGDFKLITGSELQLFYSDLVQSDGPEVLVNQIIAQAPYWSIVLPLTLLSAYMLLSKARVAKLSVPKDTSSS